MSGFIIQKAPTVEPVTLAQAKNHLRVDITDDDDYIAELVSGAREACEVFCGRSFAIKSYMQTLDAFPYYTDTVFSQNALPPSYSSLPTYSCTAWNYSQMIKLYMPPAIAVQGIDYTDAEGSNQTLVQGTDFLLDNISEPSRIFPMPGLTWPPVLYVPNGVRIRFTAGFGSTDTNPAPIDGDVAQGAGSQPMPCRVMIAMKQLIGGWYENREAATATSMKEIPQHVQMLLWSLRVMDVNPTRG